MFLFQSYCHKHSLNKQKKKEEDSDSEKNMTPEERTQARRQKMAKIEREFYKLVDLASAAKKIDINDDVVEVISKYWMLKRKAGGNKPLLPPRGDDEVSTIKGEDTERDRMKQLVNIRQDLERVRNLAYMVSRREKMSRGYVKLREQVFEKQLALLADEDPQNQMSLIEMSAVLEANHGPTIYDKMFSNPEGEQHSHEDFEMLICRIAGEISEGSAQIRKDNPFRKKSTELPPNSRTVPYERIFSSDNSQSESDDSLIKIPSGRYGKKTKEDKISPGKQKKPFTRSDSSMSSSEEEEALKNLNSPNKNKSSITKKNIYNTDSEDDVEKAPKGRGRGRPPKNRKKEIKSGKKTESSSEIKFDSEDTQNSLDLKPKEVRTKAALKAFTAEDAALAKKIMEDKLKKKKEEELSDDDSPMDIDDENNAFLLVDKRKAAKKAEQKFTKTSNKPNEPKKKTPKASNDLFGTSDDDSSLSLIADRIKHKTKHWGGDHDVRKSPRRSNDKKKHTSTDSESSDDDLPSSFNKNKIFSPSKRDKLDRIKSPKKPSKKKKDSDEEELFSQKKESQQQLDFDDIFGNHKFDGSDSESESGKKKLFDDFEHPEVYSDFVPQRSAARKATALLSEQKMWKKTQQELLMAELAAKQQKQETATKAKSKGKKEKKESVTTADSDEDVPSKRKTRSSSSSSGSSSSSDSEEEKRKSPRGRGRSPKGRNFNSKPPKELKVKKPIGPRKSKKKTGDGEGAISSSKALEYLMQRESQLSGLLGDYKKEEIVPQPQLTPDKKLKTSEGRADGVQSPPETPKNSSDSESDSSSADSVILGIKARQQKKSERVEDQPQTTDNANVSGSGDSRLVYKKNKLIWILREGFKQKISNCLPLPVDNVFLFSLLYLIYICLFSLTQTFL